MTLRLPCLPCSLLNNNTFFTIEKKTDTHLYRDRSLAVDAVRCVGDFQLVYKCTWTEKQRTHQ